MYKDRRFDCATCEVASLWGAQVSVRRLSMGAQVRRGPFGDAGPPQHDGPAGRCCSLPPPRLLELYAQPRYLLLMVELPSDVAVFAVVCDATGQWFVLSPVVRELSGRPDLHTGNGVVQLP